MWERGPSSLGPVVLGLLLVCGVAATAIAYERVASDARDADHRAAEAAAERLSAGMGASVAALQGADAMAVDDSVSGADLDAFAAAIVPVSDYLALAYADLVESAEADRWEASTGLRMRDTDGRGGFVPASSRETHVPVRLVYPTNDTTRSVLGFDLMSDPTRAEGVRQALATSESAVVGPISLATNPRPGMFVIHAVRTADGRPVGFVSSGVGMESVLRRLPDPAARPPLALGMDGQELLREEGAAGPTESFVVGGRTFTVQTDDGASPSYLLPALLLGATAGFGVLAIQSGRRARAAQREQRVRAARSERLAEFAEQLSTLDTRDEVVDFIVSHVGSLVDADHTSFGRIEPSEPGKLVVVHDRQMVSHLADRFALQDLGTHLPLTDCAREQVTVMLNGRSPYERAYPELRHAVREAGLHAALCVPLTLGPESVGVIGFAWRRELASSEAERARGAAELAAQLVGRAYERARAREFVQVKIDELGEFTRRLTESRTSAEIRASVSELLPALFDAEQARLTEKPSEPAPWRTHRYPVGDQLTLEVVSRPGAIWPPAADSLARTVADLLDAALSRASLYDQERAVLDRLQRSLLLPAPSVAGYQLAVGYRSAVEAVGMGGDWYSIVDAPRHFYAVIADVAGHGPAAVAIMAETKSVLRHVLTTHVGLLEAVEQVNAVLMRRNAFASLVLVEVEKATGALRYVNAGHPAPIVIGQEAQLLDEDHGSWLGLPSSSGQPLVSASLAEGSTLLLYTDGLVEERHEVLDHSIARLAARAMPIASNPASLVEQLLEDRSASRTPATVDDDIALVAIRRLTAEERRLATCAGSSA